MTIKTGDIVEFQLNLPEEPVATGVVVGTTWNDYAVIPEGRELVWTVHPEEIKSIIGHIELAG